MFSGVEWVMRCSLNENYTVRTFFGFVRADPTAQGYNLDHIQFVLSRAWLFTILVSQPDWLWGETASLDQLTSRNRSRVRFPALSRYIPSNYVQADAPAPLDRLPEPLGSTQILPMGGETVRISRQTGERGYFLTDFGCYELKRELIGYHLTS